MGQKRRFATIRTCSMTWARSSRVHESRSNFGVTRRPHMNTWRKAARVVSSASQKSTLWRLPARAACRRRICFRRKCTSSAGHCDLRSARQRHCLCWRSRHKNVGEVQEDQVDLAGAPLRTAWQNPI